MVKKYDLVILGGGSAGIVAGVMAGGLGMRVLLIEKYRMGGECLNTGCVPSKAIIHAAHTAHVLRNASSVGLPSLPVSRDDASGVMEWVRSSIDRVRFADATEQLLKDQGVTLMIGEPRFESPHKIAVGSERFDARFTLIATGSRPAIPAIPGLSGGYLTNQDIFNLDAIPESLLVVGGGPIGVELGQAFARLGSAVTLVHHGDRLLPRDDSELANVLLDTLREEGLAVHLKTSVVAARRKDWMRECTLQGPDGAHTVTVSHILLATGRQPNIESLGLDAAGVTTTKDGIVVDEHLRTSAGHIYACGDVTGQYQFSHMAEYEAKIAVRNMAFPGSSKADYTYAAWATFTDPEIVHIGMTEDDARSAGLRYEVFRQPFAQNDRAITDCATDGLVKVITAGPLGRILGVQIAGRRASELAGEWIMAIERGATIQAVADLVHVYPTLSMASQHAAQRWYAAKADLPGVRPLLKAWSRGIQPNGSKLAAAAAITAGAAFLGKLTSDKRA